jgi:hypothetical protein
VLLGVLFEVGWYCLWFRALVQTLMPLARLLHAENNTALGHVIFESLLARFPVYLPRLATPASAAPAEEQAGETIPPGPRGTAGADSTQPTTRTGFCV